MKGVPFRFVQVAVRLLVEHLQKLQALLPGAPRKRPVARKVAHHRAVLFA